MNDTQIKYFLELTKCLNFTKAAENLYIAQPALSRQIAKLEKELGFALFYRTKKKVSLTPAGIIMMKGFNNLIEDYHSILEEAKKANISDHQTLSIGILEYQNPYFYLHNAIEFFSKHYPNLQINIFNDTFDNLRESLYKGKADIIITLLFDIIPYMDKNIAYETFTTSNGGCIISQKHHLSKYNEINKSQLNNENIIIISKEVSPQGYNNAINFLKNNNIKVNSIKTSKSLQNIILQVEAGLGFAFWDNNCQINPNNTKFLKIKNSEYDTSVVGVWKKSNFNSFIPIFLNLTKKQ